MTSAAAAALRHGSKGGSAKPPVESFACFMATVLLIAVG
jgi:hypothetical protein